MMKRLSNIFLAAAVLLFSNACSYLNVKPSIIDKGSYYSTKQEMQYGLAAVYGAMSNEALYGNYYSLMMTNVDDLSYFNRPTTSSYVQVYNHDASSSEIYAAWTQLYAGIRNANAFMKASKDSKLDPDHTMYAEARFLRAYYHFLLAQGWGDVPLRAAEVNSHADVMSAATPQYDVLCWVAAEMEGCLVPMTSTVEIQPSRVTASTIHGILARVYLFMAGVSVQGGDKQLFFKKAMEHADAVISSGDHHLHPDYSEVFKKMMSNSYDTSYRESMWEVEFYGDRTSAESWSNGRIGDLLGLQSSGSSDYSSFNCNYAYGQYDGSLKLWDLYWSMDRIDSEKELPSITDKRQEWNMCPYNYAGSDKLAPYGQTAPLTCRPSIDKTPYSYNSKTTTQDPTTAQAIRNCGKFRREVQYEGCMNAKNLYTKINYPLLRYADVLLMYAEAQNEYEGFPSQKAYDCLLEVRERAGVSTALFSSFDYEGFREIVRNERGRELCFESLRKFDLIRWGIFVDAMNEYSTWTADERWSKNGKAQYAARIGAAVQERHIYFPIPAVELGVNKDLKQNKLW